MTAVKDPDSVRDQAVERLIGEYQIPLLRLCYMQLHDRALAEDAVQETFLKAYRAYGQFRGQSSEKNCPKLRQSRMVRISTWRWPS